MARNVGKIPDHQAVTALGTFYDEISRQIMVELLSVNPLNYSASKANASKQKINGMIKRLNVVAVKSSKKYIRAAYDKARKIAVTSLKILGREVDPDVPKSIHEKAIDARTKIAAGYLIKANASIKVFVNRYFMLVKRAAAGINQLQEFGNLDAEDEAALIRRIRNAVAASKSRQAVAPQILDFFQGRIEDEKFITINGRHYQLKPYSKLVARTEMREAQTDAVINSCDQYDNDLVEVSNHGTLTKICEDFEGEIYSLSGRSKDYPAASDYPPYHPNCVLGSTRCETPGGIISGSRFRFSGPIVEIIFSSNSRLSVTPNHMLLTPHGFAAAYLLRKGDDVFYCPELKRISTTDPNDNGEPSRIDDIIKTLTKSSGMTTRRMPAAPEYFHGDGRFCDGNINIIGANGLLGDTRKSDIFQHLNTDQFNSSDMALSNLFPLGSLAQILHSAAHASDGIMGGLRSPAPFFGCQPRGSDFVAFTNASNGMAHFDQPISDSRARNPKLLANLTKKHPGLIQLQKIIEVKFHFFHGFVYDIQTPTSLYIANGAVSSNCQHYLIPTSDEAIAFGGG